MEDEKNPSNDDFCVAFPSSKENPLFIFKLSFIAHRRTKSVRKGTIKQWKTTLKTGVQVPNNPVCYPPSDTTFRHIGPFNPIVDNPPPYPPLFSFSLHGFPPPPCFFSFHGMFFPPPVHIFLTTSAYPLTDRIVIPLSSPVENLRKTGNIRLTTYRPNFQGKSFQHYPQAIIISMYSLFLKTKKKQY